MGCKVIFAPQSIERLEQIVRYIAKDNPAAAEKFGLHLVDRAALLAEFPELGQPYRKRANVRRLWCKPYFIYYRFLADEMAGMDSTPKSLAYDQRRSAVSE